MFIPSPELYTRTQTVSAALEIANRRRETVEPWPGTSLPVTSAGSWIGRGTTLIPDTLFAVTDKTATSVMVL